MCVPHHHGSVYHRIFILFMSQNYFNNKNNIKQGVIKVLLSLRMRGIKARRLIFTWVEIGAKKRLVIIQGSPPPSLRLLLQLIILDAAVLVQEARSTNSSVSLLFCAQNNEETFSMFCVCKRRTFTHIDMCKYTNTYTQDLLLKERQFSAVQTAWPLKLR